MSDNQLINTLNSLKIGANDTREIVTLAKNTHYQLACQKHFDVTHPGHDNMNIKGVSQYTSIYVMCTNTHTIHLCIV